MARYNTFDINNPKTTTQKCIAVCVAKLTEAGHATSDHKTECVPGEDDYDDQGKLTVNGNVYVNFTKERSIINCTVDGPNGDAIESIINDVLDDDEFDDEDEE